MYVSTAAINKADPATRMYIQLGNVHISEYKYVHFTGVDTLHRSLCHHLVSFITVHSVMLNSATASIKGTPYYTCL